MKSASSAAPKPGTPPAAIRRRPLNTIEAVRKQAASLFWDARRGTISDQAASRLANVLMIVGRLIEGGELQKRIDDLESRLDRAPTGTQEPVTPTRGPNYDNDEGDD